MISKRDKMQLIHDTIYTIFIYIYINVYKLHFCSSCLYLKWYYIFSECRFVNFVKFNYYFFFYLLVFYMISKCGKMQLIHNVIYKNVYIYINVYKLHFCSSCLYLKWYLIFSECCFLYMMLQGDILVMFLISCSSECVCMSFADLCSACPSISRRPSSIDRERQQRK